MKKTLLIFIHLASLGLVAQVSGLDISISGNMLIDPYLSSNDQVLIGHSVRDFSTGYSNLESNSVSGGIEAYYTSSEKEWLQLRFRLSNGQLSASNEYQYYNASLATITAGVGVDINRIFNIRIIEELELRAYTETGLARFSSKMWFVLDNSLQNVIEGFSPLIVTGVQFQYKLTDTIFFSFSPEVNYIFTDALDGWEEDGFSTTFLGAKLGLGISLN